MSAPLPFAIRLLDGPEAGSEIFASPKAGDPPEQIAVFRTEYIAEGTLVYGPTVNVMCGDHIYQQISKSDLPEDFAHPHVMRGAQYTFVRTVTESAEDVA